MPTGDAVENGCASETASNVAEPQTPQTSANSRPAYPPAAERPTQSGPEGLLYDFNLGARIVVPQGSWRVQLRDLDTGNILFETSNSDLPVGTFTEANEIPGDTYTLTLGGSGSGSFSLDPSSGVLSTGSSAVAGLASYALSVQVNDTTAGTTFLQPFDVVVGSSSGDTITLTGAGSLGLTPSTPTFIYGLNGNDTLNATGMTGQIWMAGGAGSDTMTGSTSGGNTYLYASVNDSLPGAGNFDLITNFNVTLDRIDLRGIGGATLTYRAAQLSGSTLTADTIAWQQSGGNTYVNINTSSGNETLSGVNMLIELSGNKALTSTDVLHN